VHPPCALLSRLPAPASLLEPVADTIERFYHVKLVSFSLNFLRRRLMWLSMVRSST